MIALSNIHSVYMLGIGGIGMSALARYFKINGVRVSGYDKTPSDLTNELIAEGIAVSFEESVATIDTDADLFMYTPAIPKEHVAFEAVRQMGKEWFKRSQVLEWICNQRATLAVAGTHGKTTTSALLTHLLHKCRGDISGFVGGIMTNYQSNLIASVDSNYVVVEADEYDRSFLRLRPEIAIVTSMDADHLDVYGDHETMKNDFRAFGAKAKKLIAHHAIAKDIQHNAMLTYGASDEADYSYSNLRVEDGRFVFEAQNHAQPLGLFRLALPGRHNVENALAAIAVACELGCDPSDLQQAIATFQGVHRRFERVLSQPDISVIDDYAHHPREIEAAIHAARELFPGKKLTVVFQPHLFSRTRDLEDGFVESLNQADELILLPIYPARELPINGVSSANLLNKVSLKTRHLVEKSQVVNTVLSLSPETVLMLGAGDIDRLVIPVANALKDKANVE